MERQSGILLGDNKQYLVVSRLASLLPEFGIESFSRLIDQVALPSGAHLLKQVVDRMTTNETLWFRDKYPFDYLKSTIIPQQRKQFSSLRIWCAACSTGQEPYSVAMQLEDMGALNGTEIIATDLSERVLDKAKAGRYQQIEINRGMPNDKKLRFMESLPGGEWQVKPHLRDKIRFQPLNLLTTPYGIGNFDTIFCRNVLIYFSNDNKTRVLNSLIERLKPGGYLFLGASEAMTRESRPMTMVRCNPGLVYQKPA